MVRFARNLHFAVTVLIGLPLVAWTVTGFAFTCFDFEAVRGKRDRAPAGELGPVRIDLPSAIERVRAHRGQSGGMETKVLEVTARQLLGRPWYVVELAAPGEPVLVDAETGEVHDGVTADEAAEIARRSFVGEVHVADRHAVAEGEVPGIAPPAYRVTMDDPRRTEVFVSPKTGEILSWRNDAWRSFDRLWSLHVFGFVDRRSPRQWPLRIAGGFAALAALSGAALLLASLVRATRRAARARSRDEERAEVATS
jgi:hypothetical protein